MDVGVWLRGLGLGAYEERFRDNKIDADVLADLTDGDLEKLGLPLGDRKRILKAIASLPASASGATPPEPAQSPRLAAPFAAAERRPITVMFCDLVGSTSLAAQLDAEDWRDLVNAYLDEASNAVNAFGGHVLKKLGDGLMALFGYPQAQENDAERALRAALAIQRALAELNARKPSRGPALSARIGLDSGPVVVDPTGEVFGEARRWQRQRPDRRRFRRARRHSALGARPGGRRPVRADRRRAGDRQVASRRGVPYAPRRDAAHLGRILVVAAVAEYASAPP
jgi:hypothetical protein